MVCPKCGSSSVDRQQIGHDQAGHFANSAARSGHPIIAAAILAAKAAKMMGLFANDLKCRNCQHSWRN